MVGRGTTAYRLMLAVVVAGALALRLVGIRHGLPFSYNADEELHFVPRAATVADGDLDPHYFENPAALTYLLALVLRIAFLGDDVTRRLADDPSAVFTVARVTVALLGTLLVALVAWAGRRYGGRAAGLVAAATMAVAFLPVFYSHQALNDVATMLPVTVALVGCLRIHEHGDLRSFLLAGAAVGVAAATKYTAAPMALTVALAAGLRLLRTRERPAQDRPAQDRPARVAVRLAAAAGACVVGLVALNPFLVIDLGDAWRQYAGQSDQAVTTKLGQAGSAWTFYPGSLLWAYGAVPLAFAVVGLVAALRSGPDGRVRALLLLLFPVVLYAYLGTQGRFFARWVMPAYPTLAILTGLGVVASARSLRAGLLRGRAARARLGAAVLPVLVMVSLAGPLADAIHNDQVLTRTDTRTLALAWLDAHLPDGGRVVVEPAVPGDYLAGRPDLETYPVARPYQDYELTLRPALLDDYRARGFCWVMVTSFQRDRGLAAGLAGARDYYRRLEREAAQRVELSPYRRGASAPAFSFDLSFDWWSRAYARPGPLIELVRLNACRTSSSVSPEE